ncbi:A disintegrin and metalloproteinase with thrombospondin motifs like [Watersipora subatra]|uniref:A disintegrin and metalloproteinase with thrombospondin motifs like n=1 Tax=Watersipora subatra TaxID=2589382 RepID=UPI00355B73DF
MLLLEGIIFFLSTQSALSEWVLQHHGLPHAGEGFPRIFNLTIQWIDGAQLEPTTIELSLKQSSTVPRNIPIYSNHSDGSHQLQKLANLKHSRFYHDLSQLASFSLTNFEDGKYMMRGSFTAAGEEYEVEPFYPGIHKHSHTAKKGDHIIKRRSLSLAQDASIDYTLPLPGSSDYERWQRLQKIANEKRENRSRQHGKEERRKRQALPSTTYVVQIYMVVDVYLYNTLTVSSQEIGWAGGVDDYVAFFMAHQANEVDVRFRSIDSSVEPVFNFWTIATKLSYLYVAKTNSSSTWTFPPTVPESLQMDALDALNNLNFWVATTPNLPSDADHFMLMTSLDFTSQGSNSIVGLASVAGACGNSPVSVNELGSSTVYAHELGHNLAALHDGTSNSCNGDDSYVMAPSSALTDDQTRGNPWRFSACSVDYFDTFITDLNSNNANCLTNSGDYIDTWADDSLSYLGQEISVDEQCRLVHGNGFTYATSKFDEVCSALWCTQNSISLVAMQAAFPYTTCGNKKWCVEEQCVEDPAAPTLDEDCPFGDSPGLVFSNADIVCANITGPVCAANQPKLCIRG